MRNRIFSILLLTLSLTTTPQLVFAQNSVQQLFKQGETAESVGDNSQAETIWRKVLQVEPNNGKAYNNLGKALGRQRKLEASLAAHQKALQINPNDADAYVGIGHVLNAQGKPEKAIASYKKAIQLHSNLATAYNGLGNALKDQKKLDEAIAAFQKAIQIDPKNTFIYNNLGIALYEDNKLDEAIAAFQKAIQIDPKNTFTYNNFGIALYENNKLDEAIAAFQKAIQIDPKNTFTYNNLGIALYENKKLDEAIAAFQKAIEINTKDAIAYNNLGIALREQKKLEQAISAYQKAIQINPEFAAAYTNLGDTLRDQKKLDQALAAHQKAIHINPKFSLAYTNLGVILKDQKKLDEAISNYKSALLLPEDISTTPSTAHTLANNNLGLGLQEQEKFKEAIEHFDKAEKLDSDFIYASNNNIEARRLLTEKENKLASVESDIEFLPKNDPNLTVKRSVIRITAEFFNSKRQGIEVGTGVVIQRDANRTLILTNRHVIFDSNEQGENIQVEFFSSPPSDRVRMRRNAKLFKTTSTENELDLAILEVIDKLPEDIQPLSISSTITPAMPIRIIGHDAETKKDKSWSIKSGKINYQNQQLQISEAALKTGYSGSPVINSENRIIGIVYAQKSGKKQDFAYPISVVKKQLSIWKINLAKP